RVYLLLSLLGLALADERHLRLKLYLRVNLCLARLHDCHGQFTSSASCRRMPSTSAAETSRWGQANHDGCSRTTSLSTTRTCPRRSWLRRNGGGPWVSEPGLPGDHFTGSMSSTADLTCLCRSGAALRGTDVAVRRVASASQAHRGRRR